MKKAGRMIAVVLMLASALGGLWNAPQEIPEATSALQASVGWAQVLYGVFGILGAIGIARRRWWSVTVTVAWTLACAWAASVASFAFHDPTLSQPGTLAGALGAGSSTLLLGGLFVWVARVAARADQAAPVPPAT